MFYYHPDHLGSSSYLTDTNGEVYQHIEYFPFGETFLEEHGNTDRTPYLFNGKELDEETQLYYYGARYYDARTSVWQSVDPLWEKAPNKTPYHFVSNNPINRIDPNGLTDYKYDKKTGDLTQVGEANDDLDRILRTNRKGEIKYNRKGEAKVDIDNIKKGILEDGMNFKTDDNLFAVGGEGQATVQGVEDFVLRFSNYIGKEIGGAYFSRNGTEDITHITIGGHKNNTSQKAVGRGQNMRAYFDTAAEIKSFEVKGFFHTHLSMFGDSDRLRPSRQDFRTRDNAIAINPLLRFFILTTPEKFEYTKMRK